jgi:hypothetical protein
MAVEVDEYGSVCQAQEQRALERAAEAQSERGGLNGGGISSQQWRSWALEQAIKMHGGGGMRAELLILEAKSLLAFVLDESTDHPAASG